MHSKSVRYFIPIMATGAIAMATWKFANFLHGVGQKSSSTLNQEEFSSLEKKPEPLKTENDYRKELATHEAEFGKEHPKVGDELSNLANYLMYHRQFVEAESLVKRALAIHEATSGIDSLKVGDDLSNLASIVYAQGRFPEALTLALRSLEIHEKQLGKNDPKTGFDLARIGDALLYQGKFVDAEPYFRRQVDIFKANQSVTKLDLGYALTSLGKALVQQGKFNEAEPIVTHALLCLIQYEGIPKAETYVLKSKIEEFNGKPALAEQSIRKAIDLYISSSGEAHIQVAECKTLLGTFLNAQGRFADAEPYIRNALSRHEKNLRSGDQRVGNDYLILGISLQGQGKMEEANTCYRRSLTIYFHLRKVTGISTEYEVNARLYYCELLKGAGFGDQQIAAELRELERSAGL